MSSTVSSQSDLGSFKSRSLDVCKYLRPANSTESLCNMFETLPTNDDELQNTRIIVNILSYLNHKELRDARLVSLAFNKIIIEHPELMWAKNVFCISTRSHANEKQLRKEWAQLRLHKFITDYNCPNFHFLKTNLLEPYAVEFFQGSVRHQIKVLKITKCHLTVDILIHILSYCGRSLEHLEIVGISKYKSESAKGILPALQAFQHIYLPSLTTIFLSGKCKKGKFSKIFENGSACLEWTDFFRVILEGSKNLEKISLLGWNAKTCHYMTKLLSSICPDKLQSVQTLEMSCRFEEDILPKLQYRWLKPLGAIHLPNLRKLVLKFDGSGDLSGDFLVSEVVEKMTHYIATLIEGSRDTLEFIELVNCPVSSDVFRAGTSNFPSLRFVNAKGSFVTRLDNDANPIYEYSIKNGDLQRRHKFRCDDSTEEETASRTSSEISTRCRGPMSRSLTNWEVYQIICAVIILVTVVHNGMEWAVGSYIGQKLEFFVYALIILWYTRGQDISEKLSPVHEE